MSYCARCKKEADVRPHNDTGICFECACDDEIILWRKIKKMNRILPKAEGGE